MITVDPIKPHERRHCEMCQKPLQPDHTCRETRNTFLGHDPEAWLANLKVNRRVVRIARHWSRKKDPRTYEFTGPKYCHSIEVIYFPEDGEWDAYDRVFCSTYCCRDFARAAYKAGYRIKRKAAA